MNNGMRELIILWILSMGCEYCVQNRSFFSPDRHPTHSNKFIHPLLTDTYTSFEESKRSSMERKRLLWSYESYTSPIPFSFPFLSYFLPLQGTKNIVVFFGSLFFHHKSLIEYEMEQGQFGWKSRDKGPGRKEEENLRVRSQLVVPWERVLL